MKMVVLICILFAVQLYALEKNDFVPIDTGLEWKYSTGRHLCTVSFPPAPYYNCDSMIKTIKITSLSRNGDTLKFKVLVRDSGNATLFRMDMHSTLQITDTIIDTQYTDTFYKFHDTLYVAQSGGNYETYPFFDTKDINISNSKDTTISSIHAHYVEFSQLAFISIKASYLAGIGLYHYTSSSQMICGTSYSEYSLLYFKNHDNEFAFEKTGVKINLTQHVKSNLIPITNYRGLYDLSGKQIAQRKGYPEYRNKMGISNSNKCLFVK